jgi:hypothetical protein
MSDSIRIVDMPDLGAVTDVSSLVGERAGSGRFTAQAMATYVATKSGTVNVKSYGAKGDGTTDDTAAVTAAFNAVQTTGGMLFFPPGRYQLAANIPVTLGAGATISVFGAGQDITELVWAGGGGLTINLPGETNSVHIRDMTFATGTNGAGSVGLALNLTIASVSFPNSPQSDVTNVTFVGSDGALLTHYWGTCISLSKLTQVAFTNVLCLGHTDTGPYATTGIGVYLTATSAVPGVVYNFDGCTFNNLGTGLNYGTWIQGVAMMNCNFTGCGSGISVPSGTGETQLSVANSQFNCTTGIYLQLAIFAVQVVSSLFIIPPAGAAMQLAGTAQLTVLGNSFGVSDAANTTGTGIVVSSGAQLGGTIVGNSFYDVPGTCINLAAGSGAVLMGSNVFVGCPTPIADSGTGDVIANNLGIPPVPLNLTPGASPWAYSTKARPENLSLYSTGVINMVDVGGVFILGGAAPANTNLNVFVPANTTINIQYAGTLTVRGIRL